MSGAEYEIIYWPVIPGRAEYIRLLFEEAGVPYKEQSSDPGEAAAAVQALTSETAKPDTFGANPPPRAVPALRHGDLLLSQTTTILQYLAPRLGLVPSKASEADSLHLNSIALTLLDGFCIELHDTHHPIAISQYYEDQKPEAKKRAKQFVDERLPNYVGWVQRLLEANTSGDGPWLYGDSLTYVDLVLFQSLDGTQFAFPKAVAALKRSGKYDGVFKLYDEVKGRPNIKAYLASERRRPYSDGIWRHYPELED